MAEDSGAHLYAGDATFGGDVTISSDSRLKSNIVSLGATLSKLLLIDGKSYIMNNSGKEKIGILAQDVQKVFPELVSEDANEMLSVNYQGLVPVLINAIIEQEDKISRLESLVEKLISENKIYETNYFLIFFSISIVFHKTWYRKWATLTVEKGHL